MDTREIAVRDPAQYELSTQDVLAQVRKIQEIMKAAMHEGEHYGVIPGTQKPTLLKPGAEKLCLTFRLDPQYDSVETKDGDHLTVKTKCTLYHIITGARMGSGEGSCSTKESKYAFRDAKRKCPVCGHEAIIKGREEYGGGWLCFRKQGGCGQKFDDGDEEIERQTSGKVANENLADQYNTVLKMANKRALVAATLNVTAASDIFTQDMEDVVKPEPTAPILAKEMMGRKDQPEDPILIACPKHNVLWGISPRTGQKGHVNPTCTLGAVLFDLFCGHAKTAEEDTEKYLVSAGMTSWKECSQEKWLAAVKYMENKAREKLDMDQTPV